MLRTARAAPHATISQIAAAVGCHPDTAGRHLRRPLTGWPGRPPPAVVTAATPRQLRSAALSADAWTDRRLLRDASADGKIGRHIEAAARPDCPPELLARFARSYDHQVRAAAAGNSRCPAAVLRTLAVDPSGTVRAAVAGNPTASPAMLTAGLCDSYHLVRRAAAGNPRAPGWLLSAAARHSDERVRRAVAGNRACPPRVLACLSVDRDRRARDIAQLRMSRLR